MKTIKKLSDLKTGQTAKVFRVRTHDQELMRKILAMGVSPGIKIKLRQKFPSYVFQLGNSQFAVDQTVAQHIDVQIE